MTIQKISLLASICMFPIANLLNSLDLIQVLSLLKYLDMTFPPNLNKFFSATGEILIDLRPQFVKNIQEKFAEHKNATKKIIDEQNQAILRLYKLDKQINSTLELEKKNKNYLAPPPKFLGDDYHSYFALNASIFQFMVMIFLVLLYLMFKMVPKKKNKYYMLIYHYFKFLLKYNMLYGLV